MSRTKKIFLGDSVETEIDILKWKRLPKETKEEFRKARDKKYLKTHPEIAEMLTEIIFGKKISLENMGIWQ